MSLTSLCARFSQCLLIRNSSHLRTTVLAHRSASDSKKFHKEKVFLNEVRLLGRVGAEPQLRGQQSQVVVFPMATSLIWYSEDGKEHDRTDWHRVIVGLPTLRDRIMNTVAKGDRVMVLGSIRYREVMTNDGQRINSTYIAAARILNLTNKRFNTSQNTQNELEMEEGETEQNRYDDDLDNESENQKP